VYDAMMRPLKTRARKGVALALAGMIIGGAGSLALDGPSAAYLSTRYTLSEQLPAGAAVRKDVDLHVAHSEFVDLAKQLHDSPSSIDALRPRFRALIDELDPLVKAKAGILRQHEVELAHLEAEFHPKRLSELRAQIQGERDYLVEARAIRDGSWIVFAIGQPHEDLSPDEWGRKLDALASHAGDSREGDAAWRRGLAALVNAQDGVEHARAQSAVLEQSSKTAVDHLGAEVPWYDAPPWLDAVTFGINPEAALWRQGKQIDLGAAENLAALERVTAHGEDLVNSRINDYLNANNAEYRDARARYDVLKPAFDNLTTLLSDAEGAQSAVATAQAAIEMRNSIGVVEPPQNSPGHAVWAAEYAGASAAANIAAVLAESRAADVNRDLSTLNPSLAALGTPDRVGSVDEGIFAYFCGLFRSGLWSYDAAQADDIGTELDHLLADARKIQRNIEPEFHSRDQYVWQHINAERSSLRQGAAQP
jgi:hypothetical protein